MPASPRPVACTRPHGTCRADMLRGDGAGGQRATLLAKCNYITFGCTERKMDSVQSALRLQYLWSGIYCARSCVRDGDCFMLVWWAWDGGGWRGVAFCVAY
uniref:Uncharacterized protein n=1 Tax=Prymnesium polylepis TaxID=72548 RepID=A0A6V4P249_9EUKA|mmetsp:Transcript_18143/g.54269  ORF Transcript_18143/g.54269 Transcript_18143/m.54269 type:complete len:101 (+) Transcript_18143:124-426(+)